MIFGVIPCPDAENYTTRGVPSETPIEPE